MQKKTASKTIDPPRSNRTLMRQSAITLAALAGVLLSTTAQAQHNLILRGNNSYGQTSGAPAGTYIRAASMGQAMMAMRTDGTLVAWGRDQGQLNVPGGSFVDISGGDGYGLARRADGTLAGWGLNGNGQASVPGGTFRTMDAGVFHSLGVRTDGSLAAWGWNIFGQCNVPAGNDYVAVAAGNHFSLALKADGSIVGWGRSDSGQMNIPAGPFIAVDAGNEWGVAIRTNGTLAAWGTNFGSNLIMPSGSYVKIEAGTSHGIALRSTGTVGSWGSNSSGERSSLSGFFSDISAGYQTSVLVIQPPTAVPERYRIGVDATLTVPVNGVLANDIALTTHGSYLKTGPLNGTLSLASNGGFTYTPTQGYVGTDTFQYWIDKNGGSSSDADGFTTVTIDVVQSGTLAAWGWNSGNRLDVPAGKYTSISAGYGFSLAIKEDGTLAGWGEASNGETTPPAGWYQSVATGLSHAYGLRADGIIWGWGSNTNGQLSTPSGTFTALASGGNHGLALRADGTIAAWGFNSAGQATAPSGTFTAIAAGIGHSLAIRTDGTLQAWGGNFWGETNVPSGTFTAIAAGWNHNLPIRTDGTLVGWGRNSSGQTDVPPGTFSKISAGEHHSIAVRTDGTTLCWGDNSSGETNVPAGSFIEVCAAGNHSVAISVSTVATTTDDAYTTTVNTSINEAAPGVLTNDTGLSGGTAVQTQAPASASSFTLNSDGSFDYTPNTGFTGTDTFKYKVLNGAGLSNEATVTITIKPVLTTQSFSLSTVLGGANSTGTLTLTGTAPVGGATVALSSNNAAASVPASAAITAGESTTTYTVTTTPVDADATCTITATYDGVTKATDIVVQAAKLSSLGLSLSTVNGGGSVTATVTMTGQVGPTASISVLTLPAAVSGPASISVASGETTGQATLTTSAVATTTTVTITATNGAVTKTAPLTIKAALLNTLTMSPSTLEGGGSSTGTVNLTGAIPASGITVVLADNSGSIGTPASVTVGQGQTTATFTCTTSPVGSSATRQVTATFDGITRTANLTLLPPAVPTLTTLTISPSTVVGGLNTTGTVTTNQLVGVNTTVALTDNSSAIFTPASTVIPSGSDTATFTVITQAVGATATRTVTATLNSTSRTANVTLDPFPNSGAFTMTPTSVYEGHNIDGIVKRFGAQTLGPVSYDVMPYGGTSVFVLPPSVTILNGRNSAVFMIGTNNVGNVAATRGVTVRNDDNIKQTAFVTILPIMPASVTLSPSTITGGQSSTATVTLTYKAGVNGAVVQILTSSGLGMPASMTVAAGQTTGTFAITTSAVAATLTRDVTVRRNNVTKTATLTINP